MTTPPSRTPQRVLLGLGAEDDMRAAIAAAVSLAVAVKSELHCVLVEQENLTSLAGLPFARVVGPAGMVSTVSVTGIGAYFRRMARMVEAALAESCTRSNIAWELTHPHGETVGELSAALREGDIIVVNLGDLRIAGYDLFSAAQLFLERAAAIVVPTRSANPSGPVIALADGPGSAQAIAIAQGIGSTAGTKVQIMTTSAFAQFQQRASVIVASLHMIEPEGEQAFLRKVAACGAAAVLVPD